MKSLLTVYYDCVCSCVAQKVWPPHWTIYLDHSFSVAAGKG